MKKRILSILMALTLCLSLLPTVALAEGGVPYLDETGAPQTCDSATVVTSKVTTWTGTTTNPGWYVVAGDVTIDGRVTFSGDVHLILADRCKLTVKNGIAGEGNLTVYAQSTGNVQGSMHVVGPHIEDSDSKSCGIEIRGEFTINGGTVKAEGGKPVAVKDNGDGTYTFKQPSGKVTVTVTFKEKAQFTFVDVPANVYYYNAVLWAVRNGITGGVDDTHFAPNAACTRAQAVTFLWHSAGSPEPETVSSFADVPAPARRS